MKRKSDQRSKAFQKIRFGLLDALAYERGERVLTARDIEMPRALPKMRAKDVVAVRRSCTSRGPLQPSKAFRRGRQTLAPLRK
jgi:hypothetical protein